MRLPFGLALVAVVCVSAAIGWALSSGGGSQPKAHSTAHPVASQRTVAHRRVPHQLPRGWSYLAVARRRTLRVYHAPGHGHSLTLTKKISAGAPLTLLVHRRRGRWIQIYLPVRPNRGTGWVRARSVKLLSTAYGLGVYLRSHRLVVSLSGRVVHRYRIGVGRSVTPTPSGTYFITELLKQPDPSGPYGPYAFGLSAHSGVLSHFGRGGNGQIGIHGTNEPALVGRNVSHGCIRLRNPDVIWLTKHLPLGTPVSIHRS